MATFFSGHNKLSQIFARDCTHNLVRFMRLVKFYTLKISSLLNIIIVTLAYLITG